jgi:ceramide synthetase
VGLTAAQQLFRTLFDVVARAMIVKKQRWNEAVYGARVVRCCDSVFKFFYYAAMTIWGLSLLKGQPWMPWVLGGHGETRFCWTGGYPFQEVPEDLKRFYLTAVGYSFSEIAMLLRDRRLPDFWEMLLHHTITCYLVTFSYLLNYVRVGSLVIVLHGATDVLIYASKAIVDTKWNHLIAVSYFGLITAFVWFRIYVFPVYLMQSAWVESVVEVGPDGIYGWGFLNFALFVLFGLHMYWLGLIVKSGLMFKRTGQARDLQSNLSNMDIKTENASLKKAM